MCWSNLESQWLVDAIPTLPKMGGDGRGWEGMGGDGRGWEGIGGDDGRGWEGMGEGGFWKGGHLKEWLS